MTVALTLISVWAVTAFAYIVMPRTYTSEYTLFIPGTGQSTSMNLESIGQAATYTTSPFSSNRVSPTENYKRLISTERVMENAALLANRDRDEFPKLQIKLVDSTNFITVKLTAGSAKDATEKATFAYEGFQKTLNELRNEEMARRQEAYGASLSTYKNALIEARRNIIEVQAEAGLVSLDQYNEIVVHVAKLEQEALSIEAALADKAAKLDSLSSIINTSPELAAAAIKLRSDVEFQQLVALYSEKIVDLTEKRYQFGENHPLRVALEKDTKALSSRIASKGASVTGLPADEILSLVEMSTSDVQAQKLNDLLSFSIDKAGLESELDMISQQIDTQKAKIKDLIGTASALDDLQRDHQVAEAIFSSAIARNDTSRSDIFTAYPLIQMIEPPSIPTEPSNPSFKLTVALCIMATICILMAFTLAWLRRPLIESVFRGINAKS